MGRRSSYIFSVIKIKSPVHGGHAAAAPARRILQVWPALGNKRHDDEGEFNGFRWARLMKSLLREACHRINKSDVKVLTEVECRSMRKRCRTILT